MSALTEAPFAAQITPSAPSSALSTHPNNKPCTLCSTPRPVLVRCQIDGSGVWNFVCPGKCWRSVSGGVEDAKGVEGDFPWYRYGGMCGCCDHVCLQQYEGKNKHAYVSAKKKTPKKVASSSTHVSAGATTQMTPAEDGMDDETAPAEGVPVDPEDDTGQNVSHDQTGSHLDEPSADPSEWHPHTSYPRSALVTLNKMTYVCRREHRSRPPGSKDASGPTEKKGYRYWKVDDEVMTGLTAEESD